MSASPRAGVHASRSEDMFGHHAGHLFDRARAARSVLRRCANAASMTANTSFPGAHGSRRVKATSPESMWGTGQNTLRGTAPARLAEANQASLTEGTPWTRLPAADSIGLESKPRSTEANSRLSVFAQVTALISPVGICTYKVHPLGRDNRDLTWADACRSPRSSVDSG